MKVRDDRRLQEIAARLGQMFSILQGIGDNSSDDKSDKSQRIRTLMLRMKEVLVDDDNCTSTV